MGVVWPVSPCSACLKGSKAEFEEGRAETPGVAKTSRAISWLVGRNDVAGSGVLSLIVEGEESTRTGSVPSAIVASCVARRLSRF